MKKLKNEVIGKQIRQARMELGFSLEEIAKETGLSSSVLNDVEKGHEELSYEHAELLCDFLGLSVEELLDTRERELESLILFRTEEQGPTNEELIDRSDEIFRELAAQFDLYEREGGGKAHV